MNPQGASPLQRLLKFASDIYPEEVRAALSAFLLVMILMAAYYIMRPVRDAMASDWTDAELSWLWTFTFFFSAIAVSLYGAAVTRIRFSRLVPSVYGFFAASFALFYLGSLGGADLTLLNKAISGSPMEFTWGTHASFSASNSGKSAGPATLISSGIL